MNNYLDIFNIYQSCLIVSQILLHATASQGSLYSLFKDFCQEMYQFFVTKGADSDQLDVAWVSFWILLWRSMEPTHT
jgi:hypothetical protein